MTSYDSLQFRKDWVYAIDRDFHSSDGTPATWAPGQPTEWGNEHAKIPLESEPATARLNADESLLAVALKHDIHIYNMSDMSLYQILQGHASRVDALRFHPQDARTIVSCAMNNTGDSVQLEVPEIIYWNLDEQRKRALLSEDTLHGLGKRAADSVVKALEAAPSPSWKPDAKDTDFLERGIQKVIATQNVKSQVSSNTLLYGRLMNSFGSHVFNADGRSMAFLPGPRPTSNGDDQWDICIYDTHTRSVRLTLSAHRDAIMWVGFSPDDRLIASVSWDRTFRIWDHGRGTLLHTFRSEGQNWTGGFSPDARFFAGTSGQGRLWVWDVAHGVEVARVDLASSWCRTLDWSPDGKRLLIGARGLALVREFELKRQVIIQDRILSTAASPELLQEMGASFLETTKVQYLDGGRKVALEASGSDDGVEVYDFVENKKWRFAPPQGLDRGWASGGSFVVLKEKGMIMSVDADALRFWKVPFAVGD